MNKKEHKRWETIEEEARCTWKIKWEEGVLPLGDIWKGLHWNLKFEEKKIIRNHETKT